MDTKKFKKKLKDILRDSIRDIIPKLWYIKIRFYLTHGYKLNLKDPKTWNEKIQHRKLNCDNEFLSKFVDKLAVRDYVRETIGEEYLIPLLGYYENITPDDFEKLPKSFVIKTSNGGGGENVRIVWDKDIENIPKLCKQFNNYIKVKIGSKIDELYYDIQKPHILIEKLILDRNGDAPSDYKFQTFKQENRNEYFIQIDEGRFTNHQRSIVDGDFKKIEMKFQPKYEFIERKLISPKNFEKMKELVDKLSEPFNYIRVDMYNIEGKIYFGELTFCHGSGWEKVEPQEWDYKLGRMWNICK